jgi:glycosyltransferase involved in cell wall biosynthesis
MKHLVIITPGFPKDENDTKCIPALWLYIKELSQTNLYRITIIATDYPLIKTKYEWFGIRVISLGLKSKFVLNLFLKIKILNLLKKINKNDKIQIIHSFWFNKSAFAANHFCNKHNLPLFITLMGQDARNNTMLKKSDEIKATFITLSDFHDKVFRENTNNLQTIKLHFGIEDMTLYKFGIFDKKYDVIGAFLFNNVKNLDEFINIVFEMKKNKPDIKVIIAGGGKNEKEIKMKIAEIGLSENIEITGIIDRYEVLKLMHKSKVLLHTSLFEGHCLVMSEALASGCKVVSYPVGIASEDKNILTGTTKEHLTELLIQALLTDKFEKYDNYKVQDTVRNYIKLYSLE